MDQNKFRRWMLEHNTSKLTSVTSADGVLRFISEIPPERLILPAGWDIRRKVGNTFEFFNSENTMSFEVRQVHHPNIWHTSISW